MPTLQFNPDKPGDAWVVNDDNYVDFINPVIDGDQKKHGLRPRNFRNFPTGYFAWAPPFPQELLIDEAEWSDRLAQMAAEKTSLFDLRQKHGEELSSLDQDGYGYCWAFSSTKAVMYTRARANEPLVRLSAWAVASIIKGYADEGGWGSESLEWIVANGVPTLDVWPQGAGGSSARKYDTPAMRTNAALHKVTKFFDGTDDRATNKKIMYSAFFHGMIPILDYNWWSHSVCGCRPVTADTGDIDNSWGNSAGNNGIFRLEGSKWVPDNVVVAYVSLPSTV